MKYLILVFLLGGCTVYTEPAVNARSECPNENILVCSYIKF